MKPLRFLGSSYKDFMKFPSSAQKKAGYELQLVQQGLEPRDFKPITSVGSGVQELRIWVESGTYRVIYVARLVEAVYVLHAFEKKTQATEHTDLDLAKERYKIFLEGEMAVIEYEEFASVWDAIEATPEDAAKMQACGDLMIQITRLVEQNKWSVAEAADRFHTTPVKMNDLLEGRIYRFEVEDLIKMVGALGRKVRVEIEAA